MSARLVCSNGCGYSRSANDSRLPFCQCGAPLEDAPPAEVSDPMRAPARTLLTEMFRAAGVEPDAGQEPAIRALLVWAQSHSAERWIETTTLIDLAHLAGDLELTGALIAFDDRRNAGYGDECDEEDQFTITAKGIAALERDREDR